MRYILMIFAIGITLQLQGNDPNENIGDVNENTFDINDNSETASFPAGRQPAGAQQDYFEEDFEVSD